MICLQYKVVIGVDFYQCSKIAVEVSFMLFNMHYREDLYRRS
jgi:hypothetical protein